MVLRTELGLKRGQSQANFEYHVRSQYCCGSEAHKKQTVSRSPSWWEGKEGVSTNNNTQQKGHKDERRPA